MHIGCRDFIDGSRRPVHVDDDGNQYVYGDNWQPIYGVWIGPDMSEADPPIILGGEAGETGAPE